MAIPGVTVPTSFSHAVVAQDGVKYNLPFFEEHFDTSSGALNTRLDYYTIVSDLGGLRIGTVPVNLIEQIAGLSVLGNSSNTSTNPVAIAAGTDGHVLRRSGSTLGFGTIATAGIADNAVTYAKLQNAAAGLTVLGRGANTSGAFAEIAAGTDGHVLRRSGTTLGFGQIATAGIANSAITTALIADNNVTYAKLQQGAAKSVIGVTGNATANYAAISGTAANQALMVNASNNGLTFRALATTDLPTNIPYTNLAAILALSVLGVAGTSATTGASITSGAARNFMCSNSGNTAIAFRAMEVADLPTANWVGATSAASINFAGYSILNNASAQNTGFSITLPTPGKYRVHLDTRMTILASAAVAECFFYNSTTAAYVASRLLCADNITKDTQYSMSEIITTTTNNNVIQLHVRKSGTAMAGDYVVNAQAWLNYNKISQ